jgi:alkanesulfonate monooxygenase SsuD/methylene tetrahydromethanopterin reductase-like flavin-dependent oxidoreductase (luciferase family)
VLVANIVNRHPAQLASAVNSLQSLAPGRVVLGVGSGAAPGSRFAVEHDAIGTELADTASRRRHLRDYIGALRAIWAGSPAYDAAAGTAFDGLTAVVDGAAVPRIIVGASAWPTIELAAEVADGVNVRCTPALPEQLRRLAALGLPDDFEISVLDDLSRRPSVAPVLADASRPGNWVGVRRRIVTVRVAPGADARLAGDGFRSPA